MTTSKKTHENAMAEEWERLSSNPDNVIVSDVLKGTLPFLDESPEVLLHLTGPEARPATLSVHQIAKVDMGWAIVASATLRDALRFIKTPAPQWNSLVIKHEIYIIRDFSLSDWKLEPCVDFPETGGGSCTVSLVLRPRHVEQTRVL